MELDCLFVHVPKMNNRYKPFGDTLYVKSMAIGLLAMADKLQREGFAAQVVHMGVEYVAGKFDIYEYVRETRARVVGFSLHWHPQSYDVIETARLVKEKCPGVFVLLGGLTASYFSDEIMQEYKFIDGIIKGDGETPVVSLVDKIKKQDADLSTVPNLLWRNVGAVVNNGISYVAEDEEINDLNYMSYSLLKNHRIYIDVFGRSPANYLKGASPSFNTMRRSKPSVIMPIARGCSANCKWCGGSAHAHKLNSGRKRYIFRSYDRVLTDIRQAQEQGFGILHFAHYSHPDETAYYVELFKALRNENIKVDAYFECSALPTRELVDAFVETFTDRTSSVMCLSRMAPGEKVRKLNVGRFYTNDELFDILAYMDSKGVRMELTFTLGMPGETEDEIPKLVAFRKKILTGIKHVRSSVVLTSQIEPGSQWFLRPERFGIQTDLRKFSDFHKFHSISNSYYTHLGYSIPGYFRDGKSDSIELFRSRIQSVRCKYFCLLSGNRIGYGANVLGRAKCLALSIFWGLRLGRFLPGRTSN